MILTDKAKEDFLKWNENNNAPLSTYAIKNDLIHGTILNALIIEWFDSVNIIVSISYNCDDDWCHEIEHDPYISNGYFYETRQESTTKAIEHANNIYNKR